MTVLLTVFWLIVLGALALIGLSLLALGLIYKALDDGGRDE